MSKPSPARYPTTNRSGDTSSLRKRGSPLIWVDSQMTRRAPPDGSSSRPAVLWDAAIRFGLTVKDPFKFPSRQTTGMVASLLRISNLLLWMPLGLQGISERLDM